jgi:hypothetical protein
MTSCPNTLTITINRAAVFTATSSTVTVVGTTVTVSYPYTQWQFNSVIKLLFPSSTGYAAPMIIESSTVHNQL